MKAFACLIINLVLYVPFMHYVWVGTPDYEVNMTAAVLGCAAGWLLACFCEYYNDPDNNNRS